MSCNNISINQILNSTIDSTENVTTGLVLELYSFIQSGKIVGAEACKFLKYPEILAKKFTSNCSKLKAKAKGKRGKYLEEFLKEKFEISSDCGNLACKNLKTNLKNLNKTIEYVEKQNENQKEKLLVDGKEKKHLNKKIKQLQNSRALQLKKLKTANNTLNVEKQQSKVTSRNLRDKNILILKKEKQIKELRKRLGNLTVEANRLKGELKKERRLRNFEVNDCNVKISEGLRK